MKKDEIVVPGYYAYLLRIDYLDNTQEDIIKMLDKFIDNENIEAFHIYEEISKKVKKLHIQAIVWSDRIYTPTMCQTVKRKYFKKIINKKPRGVAFTDARKPQNLAAYSAKDQEEIMSSLSEEELGRIPRWKNIKEYKDREFKDNLKKWFKENSHLPLRKFMVDLTQLHWDNNRAQPARHTMIKYLGIHHPDYSAETYIESLGIIPFHIQNAYNDSNI